MKRIAILAAFCLAGCAHTAEQKLAAAQQRAAEIAQQKRCAAVEIYPSGMSPARPYRVLGPVGVDADQIATHRDRVLQERACALGADAVIDLRDFRVARQDPDGVAGAQPDLVIDLTGMAIAWAEPAQK